MPSPIFYLPGYPRLNKVNDTVPGGVSSPAAVPALGQIIELTDEFASKLSDTTVGILRAGKYQYVKFVTAATRGQACFWDSAANNGLQDFEVTTAAGALISGLVAGIAICSVSAGNYGWIQIDGLATVQCAAAVAATTIGSPAVTRTADATIDSVADATSITAGILKLLIGTFYEAPANGAFRQVQLRGLFRNERLTSN